LITYIVIRVKRLQSHSDRAIGKDRQGSARAARESDCNAAAVRIAAMIRLH